MKTFAVTLKVIPARPWSPEALTPVNFLSLHPIRGHLEVDLNIASSLKGAFKTAHHGTITPNGGVLPSLLTGDVCVKHVYYTVGGGVVKRYRPAEEQEYIRSEVCCLNWSRILLDLTYKFIKDFEEDGGAFPGTIPKLHFVKTAMAE